MPSATSSKRTLILRKILHWSRTLFTPLSLSAIIFFVWQSRHSYQNVFEQANYSVLLLGVGLYILSNLLAPLGTLLIFKCCKISISYSASTFIHCSRLPGKYLPGGIWHSVGRANDYLSKGHAARQVSLFFILENILIVCVTMLLSAEIVAGMTSNSFISSMLKLFPLLCALSLLCFPFILQLASRGKVILELRSYYAATLVLALYWVLLSFCFISYLAAFDNLQLEVSSLETGAVYIFSWCVGYLALFAPQGIGVTEFVSGTLLAGSGSASTILAFLFGFRLMALIADMLCWAGAKFLGKSEIDHEKE